MTLHNWATTPFGNSATITLSVFSQDSQITLFTPSILTQRIAEDQITALLPLLKQHWQLLLIATQRYAVASIKQTEVYQQLTTLLPKTMPTTNMWKQKLADILGENLSLTTNISQDICEQYSTMLRDMPSIPTTTLLAHILLPKVKHLPSYLTYPFLVPILESSSTGFEQVLSFIQPNALVLPEEANDTVFAAILDFTCDWNLASGLSWGFFQNKVIYVGSGGVMLPFHQPDQLSALTNYYKNY